MRNLFVFFLSSFLLFVLFFKANEASAGDKDGVYIVYMGAAGSATSDNHAKLLNSVLRRKANAVVYNYRHGISGFAARLSADEAHLLARKPGVVSVFPDPLLELHTTRSWDFLKYQTDIKIDSTTSSDSNSSSDDTIIGFLDTGIWPESESFNDKEMDPIPSRWKGICMEGPDFNASNCNRKIIGARFYNDASRTTIKSNSARDQVGHGTHVAATAAGREVQSVSYYGLAKGTAKGGSPGSRIAVYQVCGSGCAGSSILAAFDDAIADAFHAVANGITVVCSAGNEGPSSGSVVNDAPWILTVAASTIDRDFESDVVLGDKTVLKGEAINFADIQKSPVYSMIDGKAAKKATASDSEARNCYPGSLNKTLVEGKIVLCENEENEDDDYTVQDSSEEVKSLGGVGAIGVDDLSRSMAQTYGTFPTTVISSKDAAKVFSYINSTRNPVATILATEVVTNFKPAPAIGFFSSRGPSGNQRNTLKPDISAPGVNILAAWNGNDTGPTPKGKPLFNIISGTSMSCPHISGVAATVKTKYPTWSPSMIRSAIMTTAFQINNLKEPITTDSGSYATPYDYGAGEVSTSGPLNPGLVYETTTTDYLNFLCYFGYNESTIQIIASTTAANFTCPQESSKDLTSNINYPSISVSNFTGKQTRTISRTVTNIAGEGQATYIATVDAPVALNVKVTPDKLKFTKTGERQTYQVIFSSDSSPSNGDMFGSITWTNGKIKVRSPFAVSSSSS
ncbi:CO(2)-response secreted protease-like isoform X2 [Tripterygium wilfordii]|uniref:CO(2)-response secreted protease-like isoform X2 n=1 Tax=Tripterygium wilfordii TaxID=458696 RepID=UPI0018F86429|nr:CO(2)-response secreted protease-like isoform X2 [Tripterygium wilfordii]